MSLSATAAAFLGFLASLIACLAIVKTQHWHGRLSLDSTFGVQKFHTAPTPRVGGVAIVLGIMSAYAAAPRPVALILGPILIAGIPAFAAGIVEDLTKQVGVKERLAATVLSGALAWLLTGALLRNTGVVALDLMLAFVPFAVVFTAFAVGGMANAVNIIDGFNGLAGGVVVIMLTALGYIALQVGDADLAAMCSLLAACVLGFLAVNWPFGKIFLGDGGAYLLGFLVGWIAVMLPARNPQVSAWCALLACAYPVLEVGFSVYRKSRREGSSPGQPDRVHLHMLVHRRLVRCRMAVRSSWLRNAMTSPFGWLYSGAIAAWAVAFVHNTRALIIGFVFAALAYWGVYTRLAKFRWWPAPTRIAGVRMEGLRAVLPRFEFPRRVNPAARATPRHVVHPHAHPVSRLMYGLLGLVSCFSIIEPAPYELLALILMFAYATRHLADGSWMLARPLTATLLVLMALFSLLQFVPIVVQAHSPDTSAFYALVTAMLIAIGVHLGRLHASGDVRFRDFIVGYAIAGLFSAVVGLISLRPDVATMAPEILGMGRPKGFFKDPNVFAPYLIPATLVFLEAAGQRRGPMTILFICFALVCTAGVISAASRGAWVNLAVTIAVYAVFCSARQKAMVAYAVLIAAVAIAVGSNLMGEGGDDQRFALYTDRMQLQEYDRDRFSAGLEAVELGLRYPAGVGPGEITNYLGKGMDPHNTYARIWAENGPAALVLFVAILLLLAAHLVQECVTARRLDRVFICAFAMLAGALVNAGVIDTLHWRHFWVVLAVCMFSFNDRLRPSPSRNPAIAATSAARAAFRS